MRAIAGKRKKKKKSRENKFAHLLRVKALAWLPVPQWQVRFPGGARQKTSYYRETVNWIDDLSHLGEGGSAIACVLK